MSDAALPRAILPIAGQMMKFTFSRAAACAIGALSLGFFALTASALAQNAEPPLAPHRALYIITMTNAHPGGNYVDVNGKMYFEFADACNDWTTSQKFMLNTVDSDGKRGSSESDYTSSETKAGDSFTFSVRKTQDGQTEAVKGVARRGAPGTPGTVEFSKPEHKIFGLPPQFMFPTAQTVTMLDHARKGDRFFSGQMFDGTEESGTVPFNAVLLKPAAPPSDLQVKSPLLKAPARRIRIAFYPAVNGSGPQTKAGLANGGRADYEQTMILHDNGVISDMEVDMGDYSVHYRLQALQPMPHPKCS